MQVQSLAIPESSVAFIVFFPKKEKKVKAPLEVVNLNRVNLKKFVEDMDGKFVSVDFLKIDGNKRTLTGRLGVKKFLKGGDNKVEALDRPYLTMFDVQAMGYRTVSLDTVSEIRALRKIYKIVDLQLRRTLRNAYPLA